MELAGAAPSPPSAARRPDASNADDPRPRNASRLLDPIVASRKFENELARFRCVEAQLRRRGCFLVGVDRPRLNFIFAAPQLRPHPLVFGAEFDLTDFDLRPMGVRLVDPFSQTPYSAKDLPTHLVRVRATNVQVPGLPPGASMLNEERIIQWYDWLPNSEPFMCLVGVKSYHDHPYHSADAWATHRTTGEGSVVTILETLLRYGVEQAALRIQHVPVLAQQARPE